MSKIKIEEFLSDKDSKRLVKELSFEDGIKLLEELVGKVESGTLPLEKAVSSYELGAQIIERLKTLLSGAEEKLKILQKE